MKARSQKQKSMIIIKKCHKCDYINETLDEPEKCQHCESAFLPLNYMEKIHQKRSKNFTLYASSDQVKEKDLIKGLYVLW